jgi:hypothetical protein
MKWALLCHQDFHEGFPSRETLNKGLMVTFIQPGGCTINILRFPTNEAVRKDFAQPSKKRLGWVLMRLLCKYDWRKALLFSKKNLDSNINCNSVSGGVSLDRHTSVFSFTATVPLVATNPIVHSRSPMAHSVVQFRFCFLSLAIAPPSRVEPD